MTFFFQWRFCSIHVLYSILVILLIFQSFFIITIFFTVIFDSTIVIVLGLPSDPHPCKVAKLIDKCVCSNCSTDQLIALPLSLLLGFPFPEIQFSFERSAAIIKCCQTALFATEKLFLKGRVNQCGKLHCYFKKMPQPPQPSVTSAAINMGARPLHQQRDYDSVKARIV